MKSETPYYPIFLNINGKICTVVGGGQVALRKVRVLLDYRARVRVISPDLCPELERLVESGDIVAERRQYLAGDLKEAFIVIAATDEQQTNIEVAREARKKGILINVVDDPDNSDFILPSYLRRGDVTIAVSTSGRSPALARKIRLKFEKEMANEYASLAVMISEVRTELKDQGINISSEQWQNALDLDLLIDLIKRGDKESAKNLLLNKLNAAIK